MVRRRKLFFSLNVKRVSIEGTFFAFCTILVELSCTISLILSTIIVDKRGKICYNIITEFKKEKFPNLLIKHGKKRRNIMLCLCAIALAIGLYDMIAFDKGWKGLPFIFIVIYMASTSLIRYKIRQQYLEENPS